MPIKTDETIANEEQKRKNLVTSGGQTAMGFGGIKKNLELN